jgi:hypothetical protein
MSNNNVSHEGEHEVIARQLVTILAPLVLGFAVRKLESWLSKRSEPRSGSPSPLPFPVNEVSGQPGE